MHIPLISTLFTFSLNNYLIDYFQNETFALFDPNLTNSTYEIPGNNPKTLFTCFPPNNKFNNYVIILKSPKPLNDFLQRTLLKLNPGARYLVIFQETCSDDCVNSAFETLWAHYIYNAVIVQNLQEFWTWGPFRPGGKCGVRSPHRNIPRFWPKLPEKFPGCAVNITWSFIPTVVDNPHSANPGYINMFFKTIGEKVGLNVRFLDNNTDYFTINYLTGSYEVLLRDMKTRRIDLGYIILNGFYPAFEGFEQTRPLYQMEEFFVFPPRKKLPVTSRFLDILSPGALLLVVFSIAVLGLLWKSYTADSLLDSIFLLCQVYIQGVIRAPPRDGFLVILYTSFLYSSMVLNWSYLSQLSSVLTEPSLEPHVKTLSDIIKMQKPIKFSDLHEKTLTQFGNETYHDLLRIRMQEQINFTTLLSDFVSQRNHGIILNSAMINSFKDPEQLQKIIYEKISTLTTTLCVRYGLPYMGHINRWILRIQETGLVAKWYFTANSKTVKVRLSEMEEHQVRINLRHVVSPFLMLAYGWVLAVLVFFSEKVYRKYKSNSVDFGSG